MPHKSREQIYDRDYYSKTFLSSKLAPDFVKPISVQESGSEDSNPKMFYSGKTLHSVTVLLL